MSGLETSVRKLVREEARSATLESIEELNAAVRDGLGNIRTDLREIAAKEFHISATRLTNWSRLNMARPDPKAEAIAHCHDGRELFQMRKDALELAIAQNRRDGSSDILKTAEGFARFLIDGCLDGNRRIIGEIPPYEDGGGQA